MRFPPFISSFLGLFYAVSVLAQAPRSEPDSLSGETLDASVVLSGISSRGAFSGDSAGEAFIRSAPSIADVVRQFSGLQLKDYGGVGGMKTVNVRSLGSEHTGVFIDGIPVENAQNMQVDLGRFSTSSFSSVELRNGLSSSSYPSAREIGNSSSLYFVQKAPTFSEGKNSSFRIGVRGGSFGTFSPSFSWDAKVGKNTVSSFEAELLSSNGHYRFHESRFRTLPDGKVVGYDTTMIRRNGDILSMRVQEHLHGDNCVDRWNVTLYMYSSDRGLPGPVVRRPSDSVTSKDRQSDGNIFLQGDWTRDRGELYSFDLRAKYALDLTRYRTNPWAEAAALPLDNHYTQNSLFLSMSNLFRLGERFSLSQATDFQVNHLDADVLYFVYPTRWSLWNAVRGAYASPSLDMSASLQHMVAFDRFSDDARKGGFKKVNSSRSTFSPALDFSVRPFGGSPSFVIDGFAKRSVRLPSFNDLYYSVVGNTQLRPEKASQYDAAITWRKLPSGHWTGEARIEGYFNRLVDKIVALPTANQFRWTMYNIGKVDVNGAEVKTSLAYDRDMFREGEIGNGFSLLLKYTFQRAIDRSEKGKSTYGGQIPYIPVHSGTLSLDVFIRGWRLDVSVLGNSRRWSSSANREDFEIDPYVTADASLSKSFTFQRGTQLRLQLNIGNILGEQYEVVKGYPMPGTNAILKTEYCF
ncbi:MAG: TonB-dependent receptor plug domain-containing protein [Bacteroidales bacterium]|nr:TonB-dependent receptor plug domain-containing protein [Bacteroidales bacterium]